MKLREHFLTEQFTQAKKEYRSVKDCMKQADKSLKNGNMNMAKYLLEDALKSVRELCELSAEEKKHREHMNVMGAEGSHVQVIRGIIHE